MKQGLPLTRATDAAKATEVAHQFEALIAVSLLRAARAADLGDDGLGANPGNSRSADEARFKMVERIIAARLAGDPTLKGLKGQIRLVRVRDGMRIDMVERVDFSMFDSASSVFRPDALGLVRLVASAIGDTPNRLTVRGHTDSQAYDRPGASNWTLSTARADATRRAFAAAGVDERRLRRIEGVADTDPFNPKDRKDPRNRRISVTLLYNDT